MWSAKDTDTWNVAVPLGFLWSLLPALGRFARFPSTVSPARCAGLYRGRTSQLMLCDRRRENKNCLALVSSEVIYFQKLTESHCRGFIYFYSECHYSVMQGTWAHNEVYSYKLECGGCLLMCRLSPGRGRRRFSGTWWWVGSWHWCLGKCPCFAMDCPADMSSQALGLSLWEGACVPLLPDHLSSLYWSKKKKKKIGCGPPSFSSLFLWATPRISRNPEAPPANEFALDLSIVST